MFHWKIPLATALLLTCALTTQAEGTPPYGSQKDVTFAEKLWKALHDDLLIGPEGIYSTPHKGRPPHGAFLDTFTTHVSIDGQRFAVIVQRSYEGEQINRRSVANAPSEWLQSISVMLKHPDYAPRDRDWFWARYAPDGSIQRDTHNLPQAGLVGKGRSKGCISCHIMAPGGDMVFNHNRFSARKKP